METKKPIDLLALQDKLKQEEQSKSLADANSLSEEEIASYEKAQREVNIERLRIENEDLRLKLNIQREIHILEQQRLILENNTRNLANEDQKQDTQERKKYAQRIFWMLCSWLVIVLAAIVTSGSKAWDFHLSDAIVLALIGSMTANVAGFFFAVVKYLFPEKGSNK
ncbi:hypothetical protein [Xanthocytophaga agilis]|uniref:Uncharacterized protein n=1 Tax=Xanthocytophaga agilis TaxID=3048010 RepID=A0AAE3R1M4_9BACT|nr:hypothetical protein [Xanthocytophaga agilis]MDJ1499962.1 hypothetical protein [Xanthocytophaga agilis]